MKGQKSRVFFIEAEKNSSGFRTGEPGLPQDLSVSAGASAAGTSATGASAAGTASAGAGTWAGPGAMGPAAGMEERVHHGAVAVAAHISADAVQQAETHCRADDLVQGIVAAVGFAGGLLPFAVQGKAAVGTEVCVIIRNFKSAVCAKIGHGTPSFQASGMFTAEYSIPQNRKKCNDELGKNVGAASADRGGCERVAGRSTPEAPLCRPDFGQMSFGFNARKGLVVVFSLDFVADGIYNII